MKTLRTGDFSELSQRKQPIHIAVGMFDGLHVGHQSVIQSALQAAELDGGISGVLTFHPHPSHLFRPANPTPQIYPTEVKQELLREMGVDLCLVQDFNEDFASNTAKQFVSWLRSIIPTLKSISVGENFRFGRGRSGSPTVLVEHLRKQGISVYSCERVHLDGEPISSTRIRQMLEQSPIEKINHLLGRPYHSVGTVQQGKKLGREIGFPTLNLPVAADILPSFGVYLARFKTIQPKRSTPRFAIANFGIRPTMEKTDSPLLEVHSLEDCPATYGDQILVEWIRKIRPEKKFNGLEELRASIRADRETALQWIKT